MLPNRHCRANKLMRISYHQAQSIFASDLPAIPLFSVSVVAAAAPICVTSILDATANPCGTSKPLTKGRLAKK